MFVRLSFFCRLYKASFERAAIGFGSRIAGALRT